jgi:uncharacterized protein YkwD
MRLFVVLLALAVLLCGSVMPAMADPTAQEQYWLELLNRARSDPAAELSRLVNFSSPTTFASPASNDPAVAAAIAFYGTNAQLLATQWSTLTAAPALAWSDSLRTSAAGYSQVMINHDEQSHMLETTATNEQDAITDRIQAGGYSGNFLDLGENLFAAASSVWGGHAGFLIDWGDDDTNPLNGFGTGIQSPASHRDISFDRVFKQVGIGMVTGGIPGSNVNATGPVVVTQHFGNVYRQSAGHVYSDAILTGVVFDDLVLADNFYTPGEGIAGAPIEVYDDVTDLLLFTGTTNSAGGFNIDLPGLLANRLVRVLAPGTGLPEQTFTLTGFTTPTETYGAPVTFTDNLHAAFQVVPEPGSALLVVLLLLRQNRKRRRY